MSLRDEILDWSESGRLKPADAARALEIAGVAPRPEDWRAFIRLLLLWAGVILVAAGVIFFFAYNWKALPRFEKFGLAEFAFLVALAAAWWLGLERAAGKAALTGVAVLTGALLALLGQTYQTGADTFELFGIWAALILPWVIVGRFAPLWLLWIGLLNLAVTFFFDASRWGVLGTSFDRSSRLWALFVLNVIALVAWEVGRMAGFAWLTRWGARVIGLLAGGLATTIGFFWVVDVNEVGWWAILVYAAWVPAMYLYYRIRVFDVFMLAGTFLSVIVMVTTFLAKNILGHGDNLGGLLFIGLVVIAMSSAAGWWIRELLTTQTEETV